MPLKDSEAMRKFLEEYKQYVSGVLKPAQAEFKSIFAEWKAPGHWARYSKLTRLPNPSPVQRVYTNIKRPESVVDKIIRKSSSFTNGLVPESFRKMTDAVRGRVIVYFLSSFPLIDRELRANDLFEIAEDSPPIAYLSGDLITQLGLSHILQGNKESGYASIHYILRLKQSSIPLDGRPWFELQVRTLIEDVWGEVEHILGYKPGKRTSFAVKKQFQIISRELTAIDEHFNFLHEELSRFQEEGTFRDSDPLNAENLPPVLGETGIGCSQHEINGLLKVLASHGVSTVGLLRGSATPKRIEIIKNTYRGELGRPPNNFEIIANLANLVECDDPEEEIKRIKTQIAFLQVWEELRQANSI